LLRSASKDINELTSAAIRFIITNMKHWYIGLHMHAILKCALSREK
jgi:hypothetical protein